MLSEQMKKRLKQAKEGCRYWNGLIRAVSLRPGESVVLFPEHNVEYNRYGLMYLDTYLNRQNRLGAIVLTNDMCVKQEAFRYSNRIRSVVDISNEDIRTLLQYYCTYNFSPDFKVISLRLPYGRNAENVVGRKGTTIEQLIAIGIYGIIPFRSLERTGEIHAAI